MAITDIKEYAHLTDADVEALGRELDAIRRDVEDSRGERDARYIRNTIRLQRSLEIGGRAVLFGSRKRPLWLLGTGMLGVAKIIENMELGHNVMHGQWDWMNDPEVHSANWEWDNVDPSAHWKQTHNHLHHKYTNILGMDDDVGYGLLRVTRDQKWRPFNYGNLAYNAILALLFEYGIAIQLLELGRVAAGRDDREYTKKNAKEVGRKIAKQTLKDYVVYPALTGKAWKSTLTANLTAGVIRNLWTNAVIFCGHFPTVPRSSRRRTSTTRPTPSGTCGRCSAVPTSPEGGSWTHDRQPELSDRTPHLPGSAVQSVRGDRGQGAGAVREVRPAVHHRSAAGAVRQVVAHHRQAVAAEQVPQGHAGPMRPRRRRSASSAQHHRDDRPGDG